MKSIYEVLEMQKSSPYIKANKTERDIINEILKMRPIGKVSSDPARDSR